MISAKNTSLSYFEPRSPPHLVGWCLELPITTNMHIKFEGTEEELVLAFDVGTTYSAAAWLHCIPGRETEVFNVMKWPGLRNTHTKVPTEIWYDGEGKAKAFGAEPSDGDLLTPVRWFKLHLHEFWLDAPPSYQQAATEQAATEQADTNHPTINSLNFEVPRLPNGVTIQDCYRDWLGFLFQQAKQWIYEVVADGDRIFKKFENTFKVVFAHPNGWGFSQQGLIRKALIEAKVLTGQQAEEDLRWVTEAEASVHFGIKTVLNPRASRWLNRGQHVMVVDAGGSTVDICTYEVSSEYPLFSIVEAKPSTSIQSGSIFISRYGLQFIKRRMGGSKWDTEEMLDIMSSEFNENVKPLFDGEDRDYHVRFGLKRENDPALNIVQGRLLIGADEMISIFEPCVSSIINAIRTQKEGLNISSILLVGGFGDSPYLQNKLRENFEEEHGCRILVPVEPSNKAVSAGGCLYSVFSHTVTSRMLRREFGINIIREPAYLSDVRSLTGLEKRTLKMTPSGNTFYSGGWSPLVFPGQPITAQTAVRHRYSSFCIVDEGNVKPFSSPLIMYQGSTTASKAYHGWCQDGKGHYYLGFLETCRIDADISRLQAAFPILNNPITGVKYRNFHFDVVLSFAHNTLKAHIEWENNGFTERGPATVVPPEFV